MRILSIGLNKTKISSENIEPYYKSIGKSVKNDFEIVYKEV